MSWSRAGWSKRSLGRAWEQRLTVSASDGVGALQRIVNLRGAGGWGGRSRHRHPCWSGRLMERGKFPSSVVRTRRSPRVMSWGPAISAGAATLPLPCLACIRAPGSVEGINVQSYKIIRIVIGLFIIAFLDDGEVPCIASPFAKFGGSFRAE